MKLKKNNRFISHIASDLNLCENWAQITHKATRVWRHIANYVNNVQILIVIEIEKQIKFELANLSIDKLGIFSSLCGERVERIWDLERSLCTGHRKGDCHIGTNTVQLQSTTLTWSNKSHLSTPSTTRPYSSHPQKRKQKQTKRRRRREGKDTQRFKLFCYEWRYLLQNSTVRILAAWLIHFARYTALTISVHTRIRWNSPFPQTRMRYVKSIRACLDIFFSAEHNFFYF